MFSRAWLLLLAAGLGGCSTCNGGDHTVPFKRGSSVDPTPFASATGAAVDPQNEPPTQAPARDGMVFEAETKHVDVAGLALEVPDGAIRAALEVQLDETPSLLVITTDGAGAVRLMQAQPVAGRWSPPSPMSALELAADCELTAARLKALDVNYAVAYAEADCGAPPAAGAANTPAAPQAPAPQPPAPQAPAPPAPAPPAPAPPAPPTAPEASTTPAGMVPVQRTELHQWIVTLERTPRVLEHIATTERGDAPWPRVTAALQSRDLDGDETADINLSLDVATETQEATHIDVKLLNRAGGLAHDTIEPEATLLGLADQAKSERKKNAAQARLLAERVLTVHDALCRESPTAKVRMGSAPGLDCGASLAAGRAASILTALLASQGKLLDALDLYRRLGGAAFRLTDNDWDRARQALQATVDSSSIGWRSGPALEAANSPDVRRSAVAFTDETHLLLRGAVTRSFDLASGTVGATESALSTLITDPTGHFAVSAVVRSCQGYHLRIVSSAQVISGLVVGPSVAEPLIVGEPPAPAMRCPELTAQARASEMHSESGGFRVLDWTAQGVLLAREQTLFLLPVATDGTRNAAAAPVQALDANAVLPNLLQPSMLTPDGRYLALITPLGIAVHDRRLGSTRLFAAGESATPEGPPITDVALSPSARNLAFVRGGQLFFGIPRGAGEPASTSAGPEPPNPPAPPSTP